MVGSSPEFAETGPDLAARALRAGLPAGCEWRPGQPLIVTANDYENALYNGDTGVVVQTPDGLRAAFPGDRAPRLLPLSRLAAVSPAHALTVHRSQGSQYEAVTILRASRAHLARAVDPGGATAGLVALEDLVEVFVGTVRDATHRQG